MLRDIALESFEEIGEAESQQAIDARHGCAHAWPGREDSNAARRPARARWRASSEAHVLGSVARHAALEPIRMRALAAISEQGAHDEILAVAMNSDFKDTALAALDLITDRAELEQVEASGRNKSAAKRARTMMREADEKAAREAAEAAAAAAMEAAASAAAAVESTEAESTTPPHGDPLAEAAGVERSEPDPAPTEQTRSGPRAKPLNRRRLQQERERRAARLVELAAEADAAAADENLPRPESASTACAANGATWPGSRDRSRTAGALQRGDCAHDGTRRRGARGRRASAAARRLRACTTFLAASSRSPRNPISR